MRSLIDASSRWQRTPNHSSSLEDLQRAVKENGPGSPCIAGCRSVCWKAFLLSDTAQTANWTHALLELRSSYASLRDHFLKYIKHPEYLTAGNSDPLADDVNSPWNTYRQDELLRAEILQDVQRLPDEPFYHQPHIQTLITDVLFIYCKLNPDVGGYRQGMHELLAPIVYVVDQDAIDPVNVAPGAAEDLTMVEMLDASFIEHDSFALFSKVMDRAKPFYETAESPEDQSGGSGGFSSQPLKSSIVERSQYIHEVLLYKVDPELSTHLKNIEILPQVFLIRWIRLLFSREFLFDQILILWDTLFSVDPTFELIDLICTSMLLRIRWDLLEADYTVALQLLLKYPVPVAPHGPHTFVDDAVYLRRHLNVSGGDELVTKYSGRAPNTPSTSRPSTPRAPAAGSSLRKKMTGGGPRSPRSPSRFRPSPAGVEALFQGAAKNVLEQGERLGLNQAVRDAMVEIRRNVHEARSSMKSSSKDLFSESPRPSPSANTAINAVAIIMDQRNQQLASMLEEAIAELKDISSFDSKLEDKAKIRDALEVAVSKVQLVKGLLEDSTAALPDGEDVKISVTPPPPPVSGTSTERKVDSEPLSDAVATMVSNTPMVSDTDTLVMNDDDTPKRTATTTTVAPSSSSTPPTKEPSGPGADERGPEKKREDTDPLGVVETSTPVQTLKRPQPPIPTRSTLAQSSFSWMLEPDTSISTTSSTSASNSKSVFGSAPAIKSDGGGHRKRPSANANRERTAFLFGEVPADAEGNAIREEDIFGLEPIVKGKR